MCLELLIHHILLADGDADRPKQEGKADSIAIDLRKRVKEALRTKLDEEVATMFNAIRDGDFEEVKLLLSKGADPHFVLLRGSPSDIVMFSSCFFILYTAAGLWFFFLSLTQDSVPTLLITVSELCPALRIVCHSNNAESSCFCVEQIKEPAFILQPLLEMIKL